MTLRAIAVINIVLATAFFGAGCTGRSGAFIPASEIKPADVPKTTEGAKASTGGHDVTVTPSLDPQLLAMALPTDRALKDFKAGDVVEEKNPVPLPDGSRAEYSTLKKSFVKGDATINVAITDTKSLPVLTAFIQSYRPYENSSGARWEVAIDDATGWMTTSQTSDADRIIASSFLMLYRDRFIIQINANLGVTTDELLVLARAIDLKRLR